MIQSWCELMLLASKAKDAKSPTVFKKGCGSVFRFISQWTKVFNYSLKLAVFYE